MTDAAPTRMPSPHRGCAPFTGRTRRRFTFSYQGEVPEQLITVLTNKPKSGAPVLVSLRQD